MTDVARRPGLQEAVGYAHEIEDLAHALKIKAMRLDGLRRSASTIEAGVRGQRYDGIGGRELTGDGHGDPIGAAVARELDADAEAKGPARQAYALVADTLGSVLELLRDADNVADRILDPKPLPTMDDEGCVYHALNGFPGVSTRTPGSTLCRWCADFRAREKRQPTAAEHRALEESRVQAELARRYG